MTKEQKELLVLGDLDQFKVAESDEDLDIDYSMLHRPVEGAAILLTYDSESYHRPMQSPQTKYLP